MVQYSVSQQIAVDLLFPPIIASLIWLLSRIWVYLCEGSSPEIGTAAWVRWSFWITLVGSYIIMFATTAYYNLK